jgi:hypothetical protein
VDPDIPVLTAIVSRGDVAVLSEQSGVEFVVGAVAAPGPRGTSVRAVRADAFEAFDEPGFFKAVLGLRTAPQPDGGSVAVLELRGHALDGEVERHLRRSWRRIRWTYAVAARRFLELAEREAARPGATGEPPSMDR